MSAQRTPRANGRSTAGREWAAALAVGIALLAIAGGCGPDTGGRSTDVAERAVDIGGGDGILATDTPPGDGVDPATAVAGLGAAGATEVSAADGNIEVIDVSDEDIEELLDATQTVFFDRGTIETMCDAPQLFPDLITGGPQVVVSDDVRLATRPVVVTLGFAPGAAIEVRVADSTGRSVASFALAADGNGCAVGTWTVAANVALGDHLVRATDGAATADLVVPVRVPDRPSLVVSPNVVEAGGEVSVSLAGYEPGSRPRIVLYVKGSGAAACGSYDREDCWRRRTAWRTSAADARGSVFVRLPTARDDPRTTYFVTSIPRPQVTPIDLKNPALTFTIVDEGSGVAPGAPIMAPDAAAPPYTFEAVPTSADPPWLRPQWPGRRIRVATPVVVP